MAGCEKESFWVFVSQVMIPQWMIQTEGITGKKKSQTTENPTKPKKSSNWNSECVIMYNQFWESTFVKIWEPLL